MSSGRLRLVTPDLALLDAAVGDAGALATVLGGEVAEGWVSFPKALVATRDAVAADPLGVRWGARLFVLAEPRTLVGWGGFKGPPREGAVEVGYEIAPGWQRRGLATAALAEMLAEAFGAPEVQTVQAHTLAAPGPSVRVLEQAGFRRDGGEVADPRIGQAWRFRLDRTSQSA